MEIPTYKGAVAPAYSCVVPLARIGLGGGHYHMDCRSSEKGTGHNSKTTAVAQNPVLRVEFTAYSFDLCRGACYELRKEDQVVGLLKGDAGVYVGTGDVVVDCSLTLNRIVIQR